MALVISCIALVIGWIALFLNAATSGLTFVFGNNNFIGFVGLNAVAILLGAIAVGMQLREKAVRTVLNKAIIAFAFLLIALSGSWIALVLAM